MEGFWIMAASRWKRPSATKIALVISFGRIGAVQPNVSAVHITTFNPFNWFIQLIERMNGMDLPGDRGLHWGIITSISTSLKALAKANTLDTNWIVPRRASLSEFLELFTTSLSILSLLLLLLLMALDSLDFVLKLALTVATKWLISNWISTNTYMTYTHSMIPWFDELIGLNWMGKYLYLGAL